MTVIPLDPAQKTSLPADAPMMSMPPRSVSVPPKPLIARSGARAVVTPLMTGLCVEPERLTKTLPGEFS